MFYVLYRGGNRVVIDNNASQDATVIQVQLNLYSVIVEETEFLSGVHTYALFVFVLQTKVDSVNKHGTLLEVVQVLTDMNLVIKKAYISSDGGWFMDVFKVMNQDGNKITDTQVLDYIQRVCLCLCLCLVLCIYFSFPSSIPFCFFAEDREQRWVVHSTFKKLGWCNAL